MVPKKVYLFHTGFVMDLFGVSRKTIYRWIKNGSLPSFQSSNRKHLFSLDAINKKLASLGHVTLQREQIKELWETYE